MGVPDLTLRHLLPSSTPNPNLEFSSDDVLFHTTHARIQQTDAKRGRTRTLPFEATRNLSSLSHRHTRLLTLDTESRVQLYAAPYLVPFGRLSLRFRAFVCQLSPCARFAAFLGDKLQIWRLPPTPIPSFAAWERVAEFAPGNTVSAALHWSPDSSRVAVGLSSGLAVVYTLPGSESRTPGVHVKPLVLHGHRAPIVMLRFIGLRGLLTLSADGALFCWRLRFNDLLPGYGPQEYPHVKHNPLRNPSRRMFAVPVTARLASRHFVKQAGAKRVRSADVCDPLVVAGLSNGVFALYELPDHMTREDDSFDDGLFELAERAALLKARRRDKEDDDKSGAKAKKRRKKDDSEQADARHADEDDDNNNDNDGDDDENEDEENTSVGFTELTLLHTLSASGGAISRIAFSSKGNWIAMASSQTGQLVIWDWRAETHVVKQQAHTDAVSCAAFSKDGRALATGGADGRVKVWGTASGFCVKTFDQHDAAVTGVAFSGSDVVVSCSSDGTVRLFDLRRYRNFRTLVGPPPTRRFGCVCVDEAGELVAAGCVETFEVVVWAVRTGDVVEVLSGHTGPVTAVAFRGGRGTLASGSWDGDIRLWGMYERKGGCEKLEHGKEVLDVAFRPDGREVAGCTSAGEIMLWDAESGGVVGTIDGARDAATGRMRESHTVAGEKGWFESIAYSADGRFLVAGAKSRYVCVYHVGEGCRPSLVKKVGTTGNRAFDGLVKKLNSREVTDSGHAMSSLVVEEEAEEQFGSMRVGERKSLPGAMGREETERRGLLQAEVKCVKGCGTGRLWAAVTTEGVVTFGEEEEEDGVGFDPTDLETDVTEEAVRKASGEGLHAKAVIMALRLNEARLVNEALDEVPTEEVGRLVDEIAVVYLAPFVRVLAKRLDVDRRLEANVRWARALLLSIGRRAADKNEAVRRAVRELHRACAAHWRRLAPVVDANCDMLRFLVQQAVRESTV